MNNTHKTILVCFSSVVMLTGCKSNEEKAIDIVEAHIRPSLLDPSAGIFTNTKALKLDDHGAYIVCGAVNGKNVYGAYTGAVAFNAVVVDVNNRTEYPFVSMSNAEYGTYEIKSYRMRSVACEDNRVERYKALRNRDYAIRTRVDNLKSTELGALTYSAAENLTNMASAIGDDSNMTDVHAMMSPDKTFAYVMLKKDHSDITYFKFKKDTSGNYVSVKGESYDDTPNPADVCYSDDNGDKCLLDVEKNSLMSQSNHLEDFVMAAK